MGRSVESSELESSDDPALIPVYLAATAPTIQTITDMGAVEAERARVEAVRALHRIYRAQLTAGPINDRLLEFFQERAAVIWASPDPLEAMKQLWSLPAKRGRPNSNMERDFKLCVEIEGRVRAGEDAEDVFLDLEESESHGALRWCRLSGQFGGLAKVGSGSFYAASLRSGLALSGASPG